MSVAVSDCGARWCGVWAPLRPVRCPRFPLTQQQYFRGLTCWSSFIHTSFPEAAVPPFTSSPGPCRAVNKLCLSPGLASRPSLGGLRWVLAAASRFRAVHTAAGVQDCSGTGRQGQLLREKGVTAPPPHRGCSSPSTVGRLSLPPAIWSPLHNPWA